MIVIRRELRDEDGLVVNLMACAGVACDRRPFEDELCIPVIDSTHAAAAMAIGALVVH